MTSPLLGRSPVRQGVGLRSIGGADLTGRSPVSQPVAEVIRVLQTITSTTPEDAVVDLVFSEDSFAYNGTDGSDGTPQTYTVPDGVTLLILAGQGGRGGLGGAGGGNNAIPHTFYARLPVTEGETFEVRIGGQPASVVAGGYNGGGTPATATHGGGGATDVRRAPYGLLDRVYVAAGGGGGGTTNGEGGAGGYTTGQLGGRPSGGSGGAPGTQTAGGAGADGGFAGSFGQGGSAEAATNGGAGGGGWFGGGGGGLENLSRCSGGGGGSSYIHPSGFAFFGDRRLGTGHGSLTIYGVVGP